MMDSCDPEAVLLALSADSDIVTERLEALGIPSPRPTLAAGAAANAASLSKHTPAWGSAVLVASSNHLSADSPEDWTADITQEEVVDFCQPPGDQVIVPQRTRTNSTEVAGEVGWRCNPSAPTATDDLDDGATSDTSIRCTARTPALRISPFQYDDEQPAPPPKPEPFVLIPTPTKDVIVQDHALDEATMHALYGMVAADTEKPSAEVAGPSTFSSVIRHRLALLQAFRQQRMRQLRPPSVDTGELLVAGAENGGEDRASVSPTDRPIILPSPVRMTFDPKNFTHSRRAETAQPGSRRTIIVNSTTSQSRGSPTVDTSAPQAGERDPSFWLTLGRSAPSPIAPGKIRPTTAKIVHAVRK